MEDKMATLKIGKIEDYMNPARLYLLNATAKLMRPKTMDMIESKIKGLADKTMLSIKSKASLDTSLKTSANYTASASVQSQKNGNVLTVQ
jgi:hypothetical protein